jgi:hypothetical protein
MMRLLSAFAALTFALAVSQSAVSADQAWKAGTAKVIITPDEPLWMAGYGGRDHPVEGQLHDLWVKVLVLEAADGHRVVVLTSDLLGIPQSIYRRTLEALQGKFGLGPADVMLTSSHTHCGPVLRGALLDIYPLDAEQLRMIETYSRRLERQIVDCVGEAIAGLRTARVSSGQGMADFAVNRRTNREPDVPKLREAGELAGPVDHAVPVLAVHSPEGELRAIVFGYACHNTTLSFYRWCGDYAGFAQIELERRHPGATALFFSGCGADQNPLPRRTVELCEGYGRKLADAVDEVLRSGEVGEREDDPTEGKGAASEEARGGDQPVTIRRIVPQRRVVPPTIATRYELIELELGPAPTRDELQQIMATQTDYRRRWAARLLAELESGQTFRRTYPYPVQVWRLGDRQLWISLGGEVVVDYSLAFKQTWGDSIWVTGYANDVMAYIPSLRVLREGGYEGASSMMVYGLPAHRWAESIEERITTAVDRLAGQVRSTSGAP